VRRALRRLVFAGLAGLTIVIIAATPASAHAVLTNQRQQRASRTVTPGTRRRVGVVMTFVLAFAMLGACGTNSGGGATTATKTATDGTITVGAYDVYFDVKTINASPGRLTVTLVNHGADPHTFTIKGTSLNLNTNPGQTATGAVTLNTGTYRFECTFPGHAAAGMTGEVIVASH